MDTAPLKKWFLKEQRDLPWRSNPTPYAVWVSEIMLQQTQVAVVIPYFMRWMERFPTIQALAHADVTEVIKLWEGLGYYSRVRNLHAGAKIVVQHFNGQLPAHREGLGQIKGLGDYTIGAILSFAFHQREPAIDGNVQRVIARYYGIEEDILKTATKKRVRSYVEKMLPQEEPWIISEALIELGATICTKKPKCLSCPLVDNCVAHRLGNADDIPFKSKKTSITKLYRLVLVITTPTAILLRQGAAGEIMSDLYEFPYFETTPHKLEQDKARILQELNLIETTPLPQVHHGFTRYQAELYPSHIEVEEPFCFENHQWISLQQLEKLPFSSGHRKILQHFKQLSPRA